MLLGLGPLGPLPVPGPVPWPASEYVPTQVSVLLIRGSNERRSDLFSSKTSPSPSPSPSLFRANSVSMVVLNVEGVVGVEGVEVKDRNAPVGLPMPVDDGDGGGESLTTTARCFLGLCIGFGFGCGCWGFMLWCVSVVSCHIIFISYGVVVSTCMWYIALWSVFSSTYVGQSDWKVGEFIRMG